MKMICIKCKKEIDINSNYYKFIEMNKKKIVSTDYAHRECWDNFMNQFNGAEKSLKQSNFLLHGLTNHMRKTGIIPPEEVEIIC